MNYVIIATEVLSSVELRVLTDSVDLKFDKYQEF